MSKELLEAISKDLKNVPFVKHRKASRSRVLSEKILNVQRVKRNGPVARTMTAGNGLA